MRRKVCACQGTPPCLGPFGCRSDETTAPGSQLGDELSGIFRVIGNVDWPRLLGRRIRTFRQPVGGFVPVCLKVADELPKFFVVFPFAAVRLPEAFEKFGRHDHLGADVQRSHHAAELEEVRCFVRFTLEKPDQVFSRSAGQILIVGVVVGLNQIFETTFAAARLEDRDHPFDAFLRVLFAWDVEGFAVLAKGELLRAGRRVNAAQNATGLAIVAVRGEAETLSIGDRAVNQLLRAGRMNAFPELVRQSLLDELFEIGFVFGV